MNSYESARRNHPAQIHADRRALETMQHLYDETAPEPDYTKLNKQRRRRARVQRWQRRFAMMWRY